MAHTLHITDGPDKPALQWAVAYPDREQVHFRTDGDAVEAQVSHMEELTGGLSFELRGVVRSGVHNGRRFTAVYSIGERSGSLTIAD